MKVTSEEFTKLVGPGGERFTSEAEYRDPKHGELFYYNNKVTRANCADGFAYHCEYIVLTPAKPEDMYVDGALVACADAITGTTKDCRQSYDINIGRNSAGVNYFPGNISDVRIYNRALSAADPKVGRLTVIQGTDLYTNGWDGPVLLSQWLSRADFRGFVFVLLDGSELLGRSETILWGAPDEPAQFDNERTAFYSQPLRPNFVEVAKQ